MGMGGDGEDIYREWSGKVTLDKLLRWSINNTTAKEDSTVERDVSKLSDLNPSIIDKILGKPEIEIMKEALEDAVNVNLPLENREEALEAMVDLCSRIDNSKNLKPSGLWKPLMSLYDDENELIRSAALWVTSVALQNCPVAVENFEELDGIAKVLSMVPPKDGDFIKIEKKIVNVIISIVNSTPKAISSINETGLFNSLRELLQPHADDSRALWSNEGLARRVLHLFSSLAAAPKEMAIVLSSGEIKAMINDFLAYHSRKNSPSADLILMILRLARACNYSFGAALKTHLLDFSAQQSIDLPSVQELL